MQLSRYDTPWEITWDRAFADPARRDTRRGARSGPSRYLFRRKLLLQVVAFLRERRPGRISPLPGASQHESAPAGDGTGSSATVLGREGQIRRSGPRPGVLLDRDGTIIVDHGHVGSIDRVEFIDGAAEAIGRLNRARVPVAVVTNQAGVARGLYDVSDVEEVHRYIAKRLAQHGAHVDRFFYCPYHPDGTVPEFARASGNRKPMPGMARAAAEALNLDLTSSWVVGDRPEDIGLAEAVGASAIHVGPGPCTRPGIRTFADLSLATHYILERIAA